MNTGTTTHPSTWVHLQFVVRFVLFDLYLMCMFYRSLFVILYFLFWPLCCLFFFDLRILHDDPFGIFKLFFQLFNPALVLFEQSNCIDWITFCYILLLTKVIAFFSGTTGICYLLSWGKISVNPVHFLLTEFIKRGNQGIII